MLTSMLGALPDATSRAAPAGTIKEGRDCRSLALGQGETGRFAARESCADTV